jgi:hypothetical protein
MNVEIGTKAAQFPEKEYINGIFVAVCTNERGWHKLAVLRKFFCTIIQYTYMLLAKWECGRF